LTPATQPIYAKEFLLIFTTVLVVMTQYHYGSRHLEMHILYYTHHTETDAN